MIIFPSDELSPKDPRWGESLRWCDGEKDDTGTADCSTRGAEFRMDSAERGLHPAMSKTGEGGALAIARRRST